MEVGLNNTGFTEKTASINACLEVNKSSNNTLCGSNDLTPEMVFGAGNLVAVVSYSIIFCISCIGNVTLLVTLLRKRRRRKSLHVNLLLMHLCIADLSVTLIMIPLEIGWNATVEWKAGDFFCRFFMFFRAFGFYLSSFILIVISVDRYCAIAHPLSLATSGKRGHIMLTIAWTLAALASVPQSVIFHVEEHPKHKWFKQCVTFNFFPTETHELVYNLFNVSTIYVIPLIAIVVTFSLIISALSSRKMAAADLTDCRTHTLRCSSVGRMERARGKTLRMTVVIVLVFIMCWTPYFVISTWWWFDHLSANKIDPRIQRGLFLFAVSNSCMDPIVYAFFSTRFLKKLKKWFCCKVESNRLSREFSQAGETQYISLHQVASRDVRKNKRNNNMNHSSSVRGFFNNSSQLNSYNGEEIEHLKSPIQSP